MFDRIDRASTHLTERSCQVPAWALAVYLLAAGCAPATAQAPSGADAEGGPLDRLHAYEVQTDQVLLPDTTPAFIEVSGSAEVTLPADRARISFAVETEAETARQASEENAQRMDEVIRSLRGAGLTDTQIETFGYTLQPVYRRPSGAREPQVIAGYRALNNVRVTTSEVERVGDLLDAAVTAGANRVSSLQFDARDTEAARLEALRIAVQKAQQEARTIASALGMGLGPPMEVRGGAQVPIPRPIFEARAMAMEVAMPTPIEPGQQAVSASVTVRYRIERVSR
jgi:uncharacterized protein YggE